VRGAYLEAPLKRIQLETLENLPRKKLKRRSVPERHQGPCVGTA